MTPRNLAVLAMLGMAACSPREKLPVLGEVPEFSLIDQSGAAFSGSSLRGHVWIADFIYTNCPGPCPLMTQRMRHIQQRLGPQSAVRLISFSVDPARDTPAALAGYANRFHAATASWSFLTGDARTLDTLDWSVFKLGHLSTAFDHSTRFILIDARERIRAYYGMGQDNMVERIAADAASLAEETS